MSSGRIYDDKYARDQVKDEGPDNLKEVEAAMQLHTDIKNQEEVKKPPTRMQRKFNRMFGAGKETSAMMVTGFQMGALVGAGTGAIMGTYAAIQSRSFWVLPASMIGSGLSFGCVLSLGMVIRGSGM